MVAIAPPVPEMSSLPTNLSDFNPKESGGCSVRAARGHLATGFRVQFVALVPSSSSPWFLFLANQFLAGKKTS